MKAGSFLRQDCLEVARSKDAKDTATIVRITADRGKLRPRGIRLLPRCKVLSRRTSRLYSLQHSNPLEALFTSVVMKLRFAPVQSLLVAQRMSAAQNHLQ